MSEGKRSRKTAWPAWMRLALPEIAPPRWVPFARASAEVLDVLVIVLATLLAAPIFVRLGGPTPIGLPETASVRVGGQTLPLGALLCMPLATWLFYSRWASGIVRRTRLIDRAAYIFIGAACLAFVVGMITRPGLVNIGYFAQAVAPLTAYYVGARLIRSGRRASLVLWATGVTAVVSAALMLSQTLIAHGALYLLDSALDNHVGPLNIYQSNDYVPFVFASLYLLFAFFLIARERLGVVAAIALFILCAAIFTLYARGPLLVLLSGLVVLVAETWRRHRRFAIRAVAITAVTFGLAAALGLPSVARLRVTFAQAPDIAENLVEPAPLPSPSPNKTASPGRSATPGSSTRTSTGTRTPAASRTPAPTSSPTPTGALDPRSNQTRVISAQAASGYVIRHPLVGAGFAPIPAAELSSALRLSETELLTAHNQYLDLGLRGGMMLVLTFLFVTCLAIRDAWRLARADARSIARAFGGSVLTVLIAGMLVGNLYQDNFTQPFPAFLLWFLIGGVAGMGSETPERLGEIPRVSRTVRR